MTYCLSMKLDEGLVFLSDSRTNAGVDNIGRFEKMRVYEKAGERAIVTLSAGNLSVTQNALGLVEHLSRKDPSIPNFYTASSMFEVVGAVGNALREVNKRDGDYMRANRIDASASFIVGGQIQGEGPRLFLIYSEGNFIESSRETCFFQIGEIKYGKPILDRVLNAKASVQDAIKCALISFDSTMRSNVSVGAPIDVAVIRPNQYRIALTQQLDEDDEYLQQVRRAWSDGLRKLYVQMPTPPWITANNELANDILPLANKKTETDTGLMQQAAQQQQ